MTRADKLGAGGGEQQRLGLGAERHRGVLEQVAHPLSGRGAAGLAHPQGLVAEGLREQSRLGGLAGAIDPLERDEQAAHRGRP